MRNTARRRTNSRPPRLLAEASHGRRTRVEGALTTYPGAVETRRPLDVSEWARRTNENGHPATCDDQSKTWDGRVLNSKAEVLAFLEEVEVARREGRSLEP